MGDDEDDGSAVPDAGTPPELTEQRFAVNLRTAREDKRMSQVRLAEEMAGRGWPWRQQTVARVESGQRMVRLGEATTAADILGTNVTRLIASTRETSALHILGTFTARATRAYEHIAESADALLFAQRQLQLSVAEAERVRYYDSHAVREAAAEAAGMLEATPEQAVADGRARNEDLQASVAEESHWARVAEDAVRRYAEQGQGIRAISRALDITERVVREILQEHGVELRGPRRRQERDAG